MRWRDERDSFSCPDHVNDFLDGGLAKVEADDGYKYDGKIGPERVRGEPVVKLHTFLGERVPRGRLSDATEPRTDRPWERDIPSQCIRRSET